MTKLAERSQKSVTKASQVTWITGLARSQVPESFPAAFRGIYAISGKAKPSSIRFSSYVLDAAVLDGGGTRVR